MPKCVLNDWDEKIELDEELEEQFGAEISSVASKHIKNPSKNHKEIKFKKDGFYDRDYKDSKFKNNSSYERNH